MYTPETLAKLAIYRSKTADGTVTLPEMREIFDLLRADRRTASTTAMAKKAKTAIVSADDLLDELEKM